jgi:hypothetical protein
LEFVDHVAQVCEICLKFSSRFFAYLILCAFFSNPGFDPLVLRKTLHDLIPRGARGTSNALQRALQSKLDTTSVNLDFIVKPFSASLRVVRDDMLRAVHMLVN